MKRLFSALFTACFIFSLLGTLVTPATAYTTSDWVLVSSAPTGAQITDRKWTFSKTTYVDSYSSTLTGYTLSSSEWVRSGNGSTNYASFPSGFDTGHWIYTSFAKSAPYSESETTTSKRIVSNSWAGYVYWHWMYDTNYANGTSVRAIYNKYGWGPDNGFLYKYFGAFTSTNGNYSSDKFYCNSQSITNYIIPERTANADCQGATRWFRFDYYTASYTDYKKLFHFVRTENNLESKSYVSGSDTTSGSTRTVISNVKEYVKYKNGFTISYDANGGTGAPGSQTKKLNTALVLSSVIPTRAGYSFQGWSTVKNSSGTANFAPGSSFTAEDDTTLYAVWEINHYTIRYDANGGSGAPDVQDKTYGQAITLSSTIPVKTGAKFLGWSDNKSAASADYAAGASFTANANTILYAVWEADKYTVSYDANGGSGAPDAQIKVYGQPLALSQTVPYRPGYVFLGWSLNPAAASASYAAGDFFTRDADSVLYAVWYLAKDFSVSLDAFSFPNTAASFEYSSRGPGVSYPITYRAVSEIFGTTVRAAAVYKKMTLNQWGGNCNGMSSAVALFFADNGIDPSDYNGENVYGLTISDSSGKYSIKDFIEMMQISQYTSQFASQYNGNRVYPSDLQSGKTLDNMYNTVQKDGNLCTIIAIGKDGVGAHAILAYKVEDISPEQSRIWVYDCNYPADDSRYIQLTRNTGGSFGEWEYDMGGRYGVWGSSEAGSCYISFIPYSTVEKIWMNRGHLYDDLQMLTVNSANVSISDAFGNEVAELVDGVLYTSKDDVFAVPVLELDIPANNWSVYLPVDYYTVENNDVSVSLEASVTNQNLSASVTTTADTVSFAVDEYSRINEVFIPSASSSDTYSIELNSDLAGDDKEVVVSGTGWGKSVSVSNSLSNGLLIPAHNIGSLMVDGVEQITYTITASCGSEGTITPDGDARTAAGKDTTVVITPNPGYAVKSVYVDGNYIGSVGTYTFKNVSKDHMIYAEFERAFELTGAKLSGSRGVQVSYTSGIKASVCAVLYDSQWKMIEMVKTDIRSGSTGASMQFSSALPDGYKIKVFAVDSNGWTPIDDPIVLG